MIVNFLMTTLANNNANLFLCDYAIYSKTVTLDYLYPVSTK